MKNENTSSKLLNNENEEILNKFDYLWIFFKHRKLVSIQNLW